MTHVDLMETCYANRAMYNCHLSEGTSGAQSAERDASGKPCSPESARHIPGREIRGRERSAEEESKGTGHVRGHVTSPWLTLHAWHGAWDVRVNSVRQSQTVILICARVAFTSTINQLVGKKKKKSMFLKVLLRSQSAFYTFYVR